MKQNAAILLAKLRPALLFLKRYAIFMYVVFMMLIFGFFVFRINGYSQIEPNDDDVQAKLQTVQRPKVDQAVLDKIQQLQNQNVQVQSLFDQARQNPFQE